jgi:hypothetical protein
MAPQQTILMLLFLLLSPSFLCMGMNKSEMDKSSFVPTYTLEDANWLFPKNKFINFQGKQYNKIQNNFLQKWGYDIPDTLVKETIGEKIVYKTVPKNYITKNKHLTLEVVDIFSIPKIKKTISNEKITQTINEIEELKNKAKLLEKNIAEKKAENKKPEEQITSFKKMNLKEKLIYFNYLALQSKNSTSQKTQATVQKIALPKHNPNANVSKQKMFVKRSLFKRYKVQNSEQLTKKISQECYEKGLCGKYVRINRYCTWSYNDETRELTIDTDDCESDDSSSYDSSDDSSSD